MTAVALAEASNIPLVTLQSSACVTVVDSDGKTERDVCISTIVDAVGATVDTYAHACISNTRNSVTWFVRWRTPDGVVIPCALRFWRAMALGDTRDPARVAERNEALRALKATTEKVHELGTFEQSRVGNIIAVWVEPGTSRMATLEPYASGGSVRRYLLHPPAGQSVVPIQTLCAIAYHTAVGANKLLELGITPSIRSDHVLMDAERTTVWLSRYDDDHFRNATMRTNPCPIDAQYIIPPPEHSVAQRDDRAIAAFQFGVFVCELFRGHRLTCVDLYGKTKHIITSDMPDNAKGTLFANLISMCLSRDATKRPTMASIVTYLADVSKRI